jgi:hypothetical protein
MKASHRRYAVLWLLALVFIAPGVAAYFFYTHPQWLGHATTNKGSLLTHPLFISSLKETSVIKPNALSKGLTWKLVVWSPTACNEECINQLDKLARIRLALGRRLYHVTQELLLGANTPLPAPKLMAILQERDIHVVRLQEKEQRSTLPAKITIFIANPENYLILAYQSTVKPDDIFHDMKHLLTTTDKTGKA